MGADELTIVVRPGPSERMRIAVVGEVDLSNLLALEGALTALITESAAVIEIDLTQVTFLSCGGLRLVLQACKAAGGRFTIVGAAPAVRRLLEVLEVPFVIEFPGGSWPE
jgi:anti-anti-sigma factor